MFELRNEKTVKMNLTRADVCDLLIALNYTSDGSGAEKWDKLHDKIRNILDEWDKDYDEKHNK